MRASARAASKTRLASLLTLGAAAALTTSLACNAPVASDSATPTLPAADAGVSVVKAAPPASTAGIYHPAPPIPNINFDDPNPTCPSSLALGTGERLAASSGEDAFGLSVTADELSAAWMTKSGDVVTVHVVDRASPADAFGAARSIVGPFAPGRVALSSDGLSLAVVDQDGLGFSLLKRDARADGFGDPEVGPFDLLDRQGRDVLPGQDEHYADPLFANADNYFIFSRVTSAGTGSVQLGSRILTGDPYSPGVPFAEEALTETGRTRKTVTGASVDVRTLFVWDGAVSKSFVVRLTARGAVESTSALGPEHDVQPTADCGVFWFTSGAPAAVWRFAAGATK